MNPFNYAQSLTFDEQLTLVSETFTEVPPGVHERTETETVVFCVKRYVSAHEFYKAREAGINPTVYFHVHAFEYGGEKLVRYNGEDFAVVRVDGSMDGTIRLYCEKVISRG